MNSNFLSLCVGQNSNHNSIARSSCSFLPPYSTTRMKEAMMMTIILKVCGNFPFFSLDSSFYFISKRTFFSCLAKTNDNNEDGGDKPLPCTFSYHKLCEFQGQFGKVLEANLLCQEQQPSHRFTDIPSCSYIQIRYL